MIKKSEPVLGFPVNIKPRLMFRPPHFPFILIIARIESRVGRTNAQTARHLETPGHLDTLAPAFAIHIDGRN